MQSDSTTAVESGSTPGTWAETAKLSSAAQSKPSSSSAPSFVRRRSTASSASASRSAPDKPETVSAHRQRPEPTKSAVPRHSSSAKTSEGKASPSAADTAAAAGLDPENYKPKLSRIREEKERERDPTQESKRSSSRSQSRDRTRERSTRRRIIPSEDLGINSGHVYRRGVRHRSGQSVQLQRQLTNLANASVLSVLSSLTAASSASSGSNSTITQKRYDSGQASRRRRRRPGQRDSEGEDSSGSKNNSTYTQYRRAAMDEDRLSHSYPVGSMVSYAPVQWQPQLRPHSTAPYHDSLGAEGLARSALINRGGSSTHMDRTNSDSGISMRDTSPEAVEKRPKVSPVVRHDSVIAHDVEEVDDEDKEAGDGSSDEDDADLPPEIAQYQVSSHDEDRHLREELLEKYEGANNHILESPQPQRYHSFTRPRYDVQPGVQHMPYQDLHHPQTYPQRRGSMAGSQGFIPPGPYTHQRPATEGSFAYIEDDPLRETKIGYELMAHMLVQAGNDPMRASDAAAITPLYRRFDFLNHRVLLHLQDDLAELEEELRRVDETIARQQGQHHKPTSDQSESDSDAQPQRTPSSRREEVNSGDELCVRRANILGRIYTRLKQYNKALASYRSATTGFAGATDSDVRLYRDWMQAHRPVDDAEAKFLDFKHDLIALGSRRPAEAGPSQGSTAARALSSKQRLAALAAMTCVQMMLFAVAPNLSSRAIIVLGAVVSNGLLYMCLQAC